MLFILFIYGKIVKALISSVYYKIIIIIIIITKKIKSMAYSSQGNHIGQLDFCNWMADGSTTGYD